MPIIVNSLGAFLFLSMKPVPPLRRKRLTVETRAGSDGFAVWLDGTRGELYRPETVVDAPTHAAAQLIKEAYENACGGDPITLVYANVAYPSVIVRDVEVVIVDQVNGVGGFNLLPRALVRATWELLIP